MVQLAEAGANVATVLLELVLQQRKPSNVRLFAQLQKVINRKIPCFYNRLLNLITHTENFTQRNRVYI